MAHPLHPALVHLPIGCFSLATLVDVAMRVDVTTRFVDVPLSAEFILLAGLIAALPAMVAGVIDYLKIDNSAIQRTAQFHMTLMLSAWSIYLLSYFFRVESPLLPTGNGGNGKAFALSLAGFLCLVIGGWQGGKLVYFHGTGVDRRKR